MSDQYAVPNKLPAKQVNILAQRRKRILQSKSVIEQKRQLRIKRFAKKPRNFKRAESFIMSHIKAERTAKRTKQLILRTNITKTEKTNEKLLVVMRHSGKKIHDDTTRNIFHSLRLTQRQQVVFLKNSEENQILLKVVEPFVIYGYPSISTIRELIFKKGFAIVDNKKLAIESNTMIEEQLGEHGIICLEDIIHEIYTVGDSFDIVTRFLCPFSVKAPRDGFDNKTSVSFARGGEYGNRKEGVNTIISKCM